MRHVELQVFPYLQLLRILCMRHTRIRPPHECMLFMMQNRVPQDEDHAHVWLCPAGCLWLADSYCHCTKHNVFPPAPFIRGSEAPLLGHSINCGNGKKCIWLIKSNNCLLLFLRDIACAHACVRVCYHNGRRYTLHGNRGKITWTSSLGLKYKGSWTGCCSALVSRFFN